MVVGNMKMKLGVRESMALVRGILRSIRGKENQPEIIVCPSATALSEAHKVLARSSIELGAQNMFWENKGSFTGETSAYVLQELGVKFALLGHSERRRLLNETDAMVHDKFRLALEKKITPIICIGEKAEERKAGDTAEVLERQLLSAIGDHKPGRSQRVIIAYEPLWAIGSGDEATPAQAVEAHQKIRALLVARFDEETVKKHFAIIYGGSVDGDNAYSLLREPEIEGVLVGGASIKISQFEKIIDAAREVEV